MSESFVMAVLDLNGVKLGNADDEGYIVTCEEYNDSDIIDTEDVFEKAREHGLGVEWTRSDFADGEVRVKVGGDDGE
ncbi:hypothetical protein [Halococcus saccharolyticus]|uniref:Uncharacterized protein n=1 Tax=Halococcus saccharolyticus DSM 5350 TaxID=1227455 RepID=M0MT71_9EURY|nr:hypothetical protein [Halococcus saccharolyticus]EMA47939.1 hypothetical protein C449_00665 [Halococcus saccharolyticus DSM 5350]